MTMAEKTLSNDHILFSEQSFIRVIFGHYIYPIAFFCGFLIKFLDC